MGDLTLFEALTGGAFDRLNWQHSGELDQNFSKKSNAPGFARGRGWAVLELTGTLGIITESRALKNVARELNASEKPEVNIQVSRKANCLYF